MKFLRRLFRPRRRRAVFVLDFDAPWEPPTPTEAADSTAPDPSDHRDAK